MTNGRCGKRNWTKDYDSLDETAEEWPEDDSALPRPAFGEADRARPSNRRSSDLAAFRDLAVSIKQNAKGKRSPHRPRRRRSCRRPPGYGAAKQGHHLHRVPQARRITWSGSSQDSPHSGKESSCSTGPTPTRAFKRRFTPSGLKRNAGTDRVSGSRTADMRSALVDYFRDAGTIMIATEAGAEGINLQFCSLVVNYDLPWNPQRIEQRIGRCHRYGQKHDVVVVNFVNRKNEAGRPRLRPVGPEIQSLRRGVRRVRRGARGDRVRGGHRKADRPHLPGLPNVRSNQHILLSAPRGT